MIFEQFIAPYRLSAIVFDGPKTAAAWPGLDAEAAGRTFQRLRQAARGQATHSDAA